MDRSRLHTTCSSSVDHHFIHTHTHEQTNLSTSNLWYYHIIDTLNNLLLIDVLLVDLHSSVHISLLLTNLICLIFSFLFLLLIHVGKLRLSFLTCFIQRLTFFSSLISSWHKLRTHFINNCKKNTQVIQLNLEFYCELYGECQFYRF